MEKKRAESPTDCSKAREVYLRVVFLKIGEIDTVQESYQADVIVQAKWREMSLDHSTFKDLDVITSPNLWKPKLQIQNIMKDGKSRISTEVEFNEKREAFIIESRRIHGIFSEHLELYNFPFDIQDLSLLITSELRDTEIILLEDERQLSRINPLGFVDVQEWKLREFIKTTKDVNTFHEIFFRKKKYPTLTFNFAAVRRPGFFIWNIMFIMALITSLSLTTFAVNTSLPQHRLQMTFTLLLTAVAFKFVVAQSLPKIPYLTYLDIHILGCMIMLYLVCVWHGIVTLMGSLTILPTLDIVAVVVFGLIFISFHVIFGIIVYFTTRARMKEIYYAERVYKEKALSVYGESYTKLKRKPLRRNFRNSRVTSSIIP
ncbi:hypothetical protein LOTGIDRAFT_166456 [Lottia gigantea]|uniref:Neurotransmitter-gated ion-channel ligand-binding domain-containing protein n=1 Tax=Lottia gigantea TaxID=225164 RepID=V4A2P8_LOTGI|nr:hypothetical protein LOTGIDRAFT_166456 [Lottia gigantea]ESO87576.1 hypothetical protein LOTGIDRAFT_166456 [Lottia gigantea]